MSKFEDIKVVGFDLDQTLYPKSPKIDEAIQQYLYKKIAEYHGISIDGARILFSSLYQGGEGLSGGETMRYLGFEQGGQLVQEALENADIAQFLNPNPADIELLKRLRNKYSLDLITGSNRLNTETKLGKLAISATMFDHIITADVCSKSNGQAFRLWLEHYESIKPWNFLYIGDRFKTDHVVPDELGIQTVIVNAVDINPGYSCLQLPTLASLDDYL